MKRLAPVLTLLCSAALAQASPPRLLAAYPAFLARLDGATLIWKDGTRLPLAKNVSSASPADRLNRPDLDEVLRVRYPACAPLQPAA